MRIPDSQIVKFIHVRHELIKIIHLVNHQHHRLMGASEHIRHLGIRIHKALLHIHHKKDHVRGINGNLRLLPHL